MPDPQRPHGLQPTMLLRPWGFPGKSTGVGCHCLLRVNLYANLSAKHKHHKLDSSDLLFFSYKLGKLGDS